MNTDDLQVEIVDGQITVTRPANARAWRAATNKARELGWIV